MDTSQSSIQHCCWRLEKIDSVDWLHKSIFSHECYEVMFTNLANVWHERLTSLEIQTRTKEINSKLEIEFQKLLAHISDGLNGRQSGVTYSASLSPSSHSLTVKMNFKLSGLPFEWQFRMARLPPEAVRDQVTWPMVAMVVELSRQKKELVNVIKNKDREISDLKEQGAKSRKKLETGTFDLTTFNDNLLKSKAFAHNVRHKNVNAFDAENQQLYCEIMQKTATPDVPNTDVIDMMLNDNSAAVRGDNTSTSGSAASSPAKSPTKSPVKSSVECTKETELQRRRALEEKLAEEEKKETMKKKKKLKL